MRKLVLWGHEPDEYREMFDLSRKDLQSSILEYGCGPSAVNAELHDSGNQNVISVDPLFKYDSKALLQETSLIFDDMLTRVRADAEQFDFSKYQGIDGLIAKRRQGMAKFFEDYQGGKEGGRYLEPMDIKLPFGDFAFDFALSSHYLFSGVPEENLENHVQTLKELARVAREVRIFPLIDRFNQPSALLGPVLLALQQENYGMEVRKVNYHLQREGNAMLCVRARQCEL